MTDQHTDPITEEWLKEAGFKWHEFDRQGAKHWLLWLGDACKGRNSLTSYEDIGIELAPAWWWNNAGEKVGTPLEWFCWFRSDAAGRYHRFIHIRHLSLVSELVALIEGITGQPWDPANNLYGSMRKPEHAAAIRRDDQRPDRAMMIEAAPYQKWYEPEKDDTRGRALPEHVDGAIKGGHAK